MDIVHEAYLGVRHLDRLQNLRGNSVMIVVRHQARDIWVDH